MPSPTFQLYSNGSSTTGAGTMNGDQHSTSSTVAPRIQLLSNNVDNVNYYDDNSQVLAGWGRLHVLLLYYVIRVARRGRPLVVPSNCWE